MHFTKIFYVIHTKCFFGVFFCFCFFKFTHSSTTTKLDAVNLKFFLLPKESPSALWVQIHWLHKPVYYAHCCWQRVSCVTRVYAVVHAAFGQQGGDHLQLLTCRSYIGTQDLLIIWTYKESHPFLFRKVQDAAFLQILVTISLCFGQAHYFKWINGS